MLPASQPVVRTAVAADAEPVAAIFAHYVLTSVATFEEVPPTAADWRRRLDDLANLSLPFLVAETGGVVCGFAYASPWRPKPAYRHTVEDTVYLSPGHTGRGIGGALLGGAAGRVRRRGRAAGHRGHRRHRQRRVGGTAPPVRLRGGGPAIRGRPQAGPVDRYRPDAARAGRGQVSTAFTAGEQNWQARLGKLRDVVRQELVARQLGVELPPPPVRIIDLGCGQGTQALRLARRGYEVTGVDASADLLARFERDLAAEPAEVRARLRVEHGMIEDYAERSGVSRSAAVLCHGVLMYLPDPDPVLRAIAGLTAPGGLVSLLVRNGDGLAMRPGLLGDWGACAAAFGSAGYANRIGVSARADRLADLTARLADHGLEVTGWYGVRVFTDAVPDDAEPPPDLDALLACEERAGRTDPYRRVAALLHVLARRTG